MGNSDNCNTSVQVVDVHDPEVTCEDISLMIQEGESITLTSEQVTTSISDNCGIESSELSLTTFTQNNGGSNSIVLTVIDVNGNTTSCDVSVEVEVVSNVLEELYGTTATVAPNPFSDYTVLSFSKLLPFEYDLRVSDITGKIIQEVAYLNQPQVRIENEGWANGVYFLNIYLNQKQEWIATYKLIVD